MTIHSFRDPVDDACAARVTMLINEAGAGNATASADLLPLVYERLRALAGQKMGQERSDHTLQATALVHEAYLRLVDTTKVQVWENRWHFFAAAVGLIVSDGLVAVTDAASGKVLHSLMGDVGMVRSLAWSPDGRRLVCGENFEGKLQIWDAQTGKLEASWQGHRHLIGSVVWRPDGRQFASGSLDQAISIWEADTWKNVLTVPAAHRGVVCSLSWSPDGSQLTSAGEDGLIKNWDPLSRRQIAVFRGHSGTVGSVRWSSRGPSLISGGDDMSVKVWDPVPQSECRNLLGYACTAWSPDGKFLATARPKAEGEMNCIDVYEVASGRIAFTLPFAASKHVFGISWSPDQRRIAAALTHEGRVLVWDVFSREEVLSAFAHGLEVRSVAWSPDSRLLASGGTDGLIHVWDVDGKRKTYTSLNRGGRVGSVVWSPDGARIASHRWGGREFTIWDPQSGRILVDLTSAHSFAAPGQYSISWSPSGKLVAAGYGGGAVVIWDASIGRQVMVMRGHTSGVRAVAWSPDGTRLASGGYDRFVKIWDTGSGRELLSLTGHDVTIFSVAWSPDGQKLATAASNEVKIWDASIGYSLSGPSEPLPSQASGPAIGLAPTTTPSTALGNQMAR